ncbi:MAG: hypothetical protein U1F43_07820 [Myxococcota bacterium]
MRRGLSVIGAVWMAACGDSGGKVASDVADATGDVAADVATADATTVADADGADAVEPPPCTDPAVVEPRVAAGLTLTVCGATLTVPAGALPDGVDVGLAAVTPPAGPPFEQAFDGEVIEVTVDRDFVVPATLFMPDVSAAGGYRTGARWEPASSQWQGFEACPAEGGLEYPVSFGGDFALLRDVNVYPDHKEGLGSGTLTSHLDGTDITWSTDDGWAIHDLGASGLRSVQIAGRRTPDGGSLQQLSVTLVEEADHSFTPLEVSLLDTGDAAASWSWLEPVDGGASASSVIAVAGGRIVGSFTVTARGQDGTATLRIDVDVVTERYRFPPEAACFPEG